MVQIKKGLTIPQFLEASTNPEIDLTAVSYKGQKPELRMYKHGYEEFMNQMPILNHEDPFLDEKVGLTGSIMQKLSQFLQKTKWLYEGMVPPKGGVNRTVLAIQPPETTLHDGGFGVMDETPSITKEGTELVMVRWGDGFSSPVHGHNIGYLHEEVLFGKMLVNTYRMTAPDSRKVRFVKSEIVEKGTFVSLYTMPNPNNQFKRQTLIHNFTSVGYSGTLHYLSEHTRDGRDNRFDVEHFEDKYNLTTEDVTRVDSKQAMYSRKGDVILVRSTNVPEYGDHFIVITGAPVMKEHGLRPQDVAIKARAKYSLLDMYEPQTGLTLLKLNKKAQEAFLEFHAISLQNDIVVFPNP